MKRPVHLRKLLLAPPIYLAALILLLEEWFWDVGGRLAAFLGAWPPLRALEARVRALPPYGALCAFVLPAILLFPVKVLALMAIAGGHVVSGVGAIVLAKIGGAAAVARIYQLTRPTLLTLGWFARWHDAFMDLKQRWIGRLRQSAAYRHASLAAMRLRRAARALMERLRASVPSGRHASHPARVMRRLVAKWRARR